jgi:hypothetical protein
VCHQPIIPINIAKHTKLSATLLFIFCWRSYGQNLPVFQTTFSQTMKQFNVIFLLIFSVLINNFFFCNFFVLLFYLILIFTIFTIYLFLYSRITSFSFHLELLIYWIFYIFLSKKYFTLLRG